MINKLKQIILKYSKNKTLVTLIASIIASIIAIVIANIILKNLNEIILLIDLIKNILNFKIPMPIWLIILVIIFLFFIGGYYLYLQNKKFLKYKEDKIDSIIWSWEYEQNPENKYSIINLNPHCHLCNCKLSLDQHQYYKCPDPACKNNKNMDVYKKNNNDIIKIIENRVLKKYPQINIHNRLSQKSKK